MSESASNICRICLKQIEEDVKFNFLNNENDLMQQSKLLDFLPEIALNATQNPIICNRCTITTDGIHEFKQLCLPTESIIKDLKMQQKPFEDVLNYIKTETAHETFKEELVEDTIIDEPQIVEEICLQVNADLPVSIDAPTKPLYYCYTCNFNTETKRNLARHVHSHHEFSYTTPNNYCLTAHKKIHFKTESIINDLKMQQPFEDVLNYVKKDPIHETIKEELIEDIIIKDEPQIVDDNCLQVNTDVPVCIEAPTKPLLYCYTCKYSTVRKSNLARHVHTHGLQLHQCKICDYNCATRYKLTVHMRSQHTSEKPYKTAYQCNQLKRHSNVKDYKCGKCDYSSAFKQNLTRHVIRMHDREKLVKSHKCDECSYSSMFQSNLKLHVIRMHNTEASAKNYKCGECDFSCVLKLNLKYHMIRMHNTEKIAKNYKCGECDYSSVLKHYLTRHVIRMHYREKLAKNYKCGECNYSSMNEYNFKRHVIRMHCGEKSAKNYKCGECNYSSMLEHNFKNHVIRMHNTKKSNLYKCGECDYSSVLKYNLRSHIIHNHSRENLVKNHKCGECEYATENKTALLWHVRLHTGEKPYKCNICDYRCCQTSNLKSHLITHTVEKSLKCELCSYSCTQRRLMKNHQQQHLKKPVIDGDKCSFKTT